MTREEYLACLREIHGAAIAAEASGDPDQILGVLMAADAFLSMVMPPDVVVEDPKPVRPRTE